MYEINTNMESLEWVTLIALLDKKNPSYEELSKAMFNVGLLDNLEYVNCVVAGKRHKRKHPNV